jgi:hypothetical protein
MEGGLTKYPEEIFGSLLGSHRLPFEGVKIENSIVFLEAFA